MFTIHICLFHTFVLVLFALVELIMHWNMKRFVLSEKSYERCKVNLQLAQSHSIQ